jgi:membrane-associated protease RseP (regulator of RpoE activity)
MKDKLKPVMAVVITILAFASLIVIHEAGHWAAAQAFGLATPVFSIGIGPREASLVLGNLWGTEFRLAAIPLGGFVEIPALDFGSALQAVPLWQRAIVLAAGIAVNVLSALAILTWLFWWKARLAVSGARVPLVKAFVMSASATVQTLSAIWQAMGNSLWPFARPSEDSECVGPIGVVRAGSRALRGGLVEFTILLVNVDLGLAALNALPVPPLDAGGLMAACVQQAFNLKVEQVDVLGLAVMLTVAALALSAWAVRRLRRARELKRLPAAKASE